MARQWNEKAEQKYRVNRTNKSNKRSQKNIKKKKTEQKREERIIFSVQSNFRVCAKMNPRLHWFSLTLLCDWSRKLVPRSQPIRCKAKAKTHHDVVARVFPRFRKFGWFCFKLSLAFKSILVHFDWLPWLLRSWFYDTQSKGALWIKVRL